jgi:hypothetical protein
MSILVNEELLACFVLASCCSTSTGNTIPSLLVVVIISYVEDSLHYEESCTSKKIFSIMLLRFSTDCYMVLVVTSIRWCFAVLAGWNSMIAVGMVVHGKEIAQQPQTRMTLMLLNP